MPIPATAPSSQKSGDRPISFVLVDQTNTDSAISPDTTLTLYVRPEDLTRTDPSRINPQQTLGGVTWADNFGPGIPIINISGHTGWRPTLDPAGGADDGPARFIKLKNQVFSNWHARRQVAIENGKDPDVSVQLQFADQLDNFASVVAPLSFVLRRSRTRPLLMQYQISLLVLNDNIAQPATATTPTPTTAQQQSAGVTSLGNSSSTISSLAPNIQNYVDPSISTPLAQFMNQSANVINAVQAGVNSAVGVTASLVTLGNTVCGCGANIFRALAFMTASPYQTKAVLMSLAAAYINALCVLENVFSLPLIFEDYSPLFGSSNCSSTSGGRPQSVFLGLNPFQYTNPQITPDAVTVTPVAQDVMQAMISTDVVLSPPTLLTIGSTAQAAATGLMSA